MIKEKSNIVNINHIDKASRCALVPGYTNRRKKIKLKELSKSKGNCLFTSGVSHGLINFIYRAVVKLKLKEKKLIFSRGAVKIGNRSVFNAVSTRELDWDVGLSIRIPHKLNYNNLIKLSIDKEVHEIRLMEIIVLSALLHIAYPEKKSKWCSDKAALIIAKGWNSLYDSPENFKNC